MFGDVFRCLTDFGVDVLRTLGSMFDGLLGRCFSMFFDVWRCFSMFDGLWGRCFTDFGVDV